MSKSPNLLSTRAFAERAGVSAGTVAKWLRSGKITGKKKNGQWCIALGELNKIKARQEDRARQTAAPARAAKPAKAARPVKNAYSVEAFSEMTYLTEFGVKQWLKAGRLVSAMDEQGRQVVDAASLELPHIRRLLR